MTERVKELIHMLRNEDNCNVLDYIDETANCIEEQASVIDDLMFENEIKQSRINALVVELNKYKELAESRLKRKNMYKERSENDLAEKIKYRIELDKVKCERDAAISDLYGDCSVCKNSKECVKYPCSCINGGLWEWRGILKRDYLNRIEG